MGGLNLGSSPATILKWGWLGFQGLNQQARQLFETLQLLQLRLGLDQAQLLVHSSSLFYISLGMDDLIHLQADPSAVSHRMSRRQFAKLLADQMTRVVKVPNHSNFHSLLFNFLIATSFSFTGSLTTSRSLSVVRNNTIRYNTTRCCFCCRIYMMPMRGESFAWGSALLAALLASCGNTSILQREEWDALIASTYLLSTTTPSYPQICGSSAWRKETSRFCFAMFTVD